MADKGKHFSHPLAKSHPMVVVALYIVTVLNLLGNVSRQLCNTVLQLLEVMLEEGLRCSGQLKRDDVDAVFQNGFPKDVRGVRKTFKVEPELIIYATCPNCSFIHPPMADDHGIKVYPARCHFKPYKDSNACGANLLKSKVHNKESIRVPIRPYVMQSFGSFLGALYSREGVEEAIYRTTKSLATYKDGLWDINDGCIIWDLPGHDKKPFLNPEDPEGELRTVWSLSYDGFNPYQNKVAGKVASVGCIALACLSLPPSLRYKAENLYLAALDPIKPSGKKDPHNHWLLPVAEDLLKSYKTGRYFTRTNTCPKGRRTREVVVPVVNDLPASRKLIGAAGHSANRFCSLCRVMKEDINNIDHKNWIRVTKEEYIAAADEWKAASKAKRKSLYKENGIRWSPLLLLPYWDPTQFVVTDGMHNLFLGLVKFHFRVLLGMNVPDIEEDDDGDSVPERPPTEKEMSSARETLAEGPSANQLCKFRIPVLRMLCEERGVVEKVRQVGKRPKKKYFIKALIVSATAMALPSNALIASLGY